MQVAQLETISFKALQNCHAVESTKLFNACCKDGIFYLDLRGTEPNASKAVDDIFALEKDVFGLPEEELMRFDIDKISRRKLNGYKPLGRNHGELAGRKDGFQSYALPKDGILGLSGEADFERPKIVNSYMHSLHTFTLAVSAAASTIFSTLSTALELKPQHHLLQNFHHPQLPSPDLIRLLKYHCQPLCERGSPQVPHTDLGSLTFLFTRQFGLQIFDIGTQQWQYVQPRDHLAIVNIGDCMSLLTNGLLKSRRHRVSALPGRAMDERYSFAYLMRLGDHVLMRPVQSPLVAENRRQEEDEEVLTSGEWLRRKFAMLRRETWRPQDGWILTGTP